MSFASAVNIDYLKGSHIFFVEFEPQNSKTIVRSLTACFLVRLSNFVDFYFYFVMLAHKQALLGECQVNLKPFKNFLNLGQVPCGFTWISKNKTLFEWEDFASGNIPLCFYSNSLL